MKKQRTPDRNGVYLLDVAVGLAIVAVALFIFSQAAFQFSGHRSDRTMRQIAVDTLMNVNEMLDFETPTLEISTLDAPDSDPFRTQVETLGEMVARTLPDGKLSVEILPERPGKDVVLVRIAVSYDEGENRPRRTFHFLRALDTIKTTTPPTEQ